MTRKHTSSTSKSVLSVERIEQSDQQVDQSDSSMGIFVVTLNIILGMPQYTHIMLS